MGRVWLQAATLAHGECAIPPVWEPCDLEKTPHKLRLQRAVLRFLYRPFGQALSGPVGTHEHEARLSPAPLTTSHPATGRFHTG